MTNTGHGCDSVKPNGACPTDYIKNSWDIGNTGSGIISFCSKITTNKNTGPAGTICGMATGTAVSLCGGRNPYSEPCPVGYEPYAWLVNWGSGSMNWCYKTMQETKDLSGTMCGMQTGGTGPTCNGYYPSRGSCPPGYHLAQWLVSFGTGVWSFCIKD